MPEQQPSTEQLESMIQGMGSFEDPMLDYSKATPHEEFGQSRQRVLGAAEQAVLSMDDQDQYDQAMASLNDAVAEMAVRYVDALDTGDDEAEQIDLAASLIYMAAHDLKKFVDEHNPTDTEILQVDDIEDYHHTIKELFRRGRDQSVVLGDSLVDSVVEVYGPALSTLLYRLSSGRGTE